MRSASYVLSCLALCVYTFFCILAREFQPAVTVVPCVVLGMHMKAARCMMKQAACTGVASEGCGAARFV